MNFFKTHLKLIIGILALGLAAAVFFVSMKANDLEEGDLRSWLAAPAARKNAAAEILTEGKIEDVGLLVACVDNIAKQPESGKMKIRDAASLCAIGIVLRENK